MEENPKQLFEPTDPNGGPWTVLLFTAVHSEYIVEVKRFTHAELMAEDGPIVPGRRFIYLKFGPYEIPVRDPKGKLEKCSFIQMGKARMYAAAGPTIGIAWISDRPPPARFLREAAKFITEKNGRKLVWKDGEPK